MTRHHHNHGTTFPSFTNSCSPAPNPSHITRFYPVLHSVHVILSFFFILYLVLASVPLPSCSTYLMVSDNYRVSEITLPYQPFPFSSVCKCLDRIPIHFLFKLSSKPIFSQTNLYPTLFSLILLLAGDVEINPGPTPSTSLNISHLNIRSASSITTELDKPASLQESIADLKLDILSLSETWLSLDTLPSVLNSLTPPNFSILNSPRTTGRRGGGLALIYRSTLKISKIPLQPFTTFESLCARFTTTSGTKPFSFILLTVYRPPSSSKSIFLSEFTTLLEDLATSPSELIITGDFNIHVDLPNCPTASPFLNLLDIFSLRQYITFPTHSSGHTLDLLISRSNSNFISSVDSLDLSLSDHHALLFSISASTQPRSQRITKSLRKFRSINIANFSQDILSSPLYHSPPNTLQPYLDLFNSVISTLLDKHAPLKPITYIARQHKPFITPIILQEKSKRSRLEKIYRRYRTPDTLTDFKIQSRLVARLIAKSKRSYYRKIISICSSQPKKLWSTMNSLLSRNVPIILPNALSNSTLATSFLDFFEQKITKLCSAFSSNSKVSPHSDPPFPPPPLSDFPYATIDEVKAAVLKSSNASCELDIIPTFLLKSCLDYLILPITTIINLSIAEGIFPNSYKCASVHPLLKKPNLPCDDLSSYRPISNLNFISKVLERIIHSRINDHLQTFPSVCPFQSAYRKFHSTETALLRIQNDILLATNDQKVSALVLLDLSAAFDTIDHQILLERLSSTFGFSGTALSLITSYLTDRSQHVTIENHCSKSSPLTTGVPQGSVLGPLLFTLYTTPIGNILSNSSVSFHLYADDTQLYISFSAADSSTSLSSISSTLDVIHSWLSLNRLTVNPSKTEFLLIGTPQQRSKITNSTLFFQNTGINPSSHARNLGVEFNSNLSYTEHISNICRTSFFQIRQLRQIRPSLDTNSAKLLANALVSSKLDYCNSLLYNLPDTSINRLQRVQNSLARVVVPTVKRNHHISPVLASLHWLPIEERIKFKIATITYKTLQNRQPSYLLDLLHPHIPSRDTRSSHAHLLTVPDIRSNSGRRSFSYAAPTIWNSLPLELRKSKSLSIFRSDLKTHLFPP